MQTERVYYPIIPPDDLVDRCDPPVLAPVQKTRDVGLRIVELRYAWAECNTKHDALINYLISNAVESQSQ